jgi:fumarate reductase iron-sulfur subunit
MKHDKAPRILTLRILRSSPAEGEAPHWQDFRVEEAEGMTLFIALNEVRETLDPALQFDFVCRAGICGSCGMLINGKPGLACCAASPGIWAPSSPWPRCRSSS